MEVQAPARVAAHVMRMEDMEKRSPLGSMRLSTVAIAAGVLVGGALSGWWMASRSDRRMRAELLTQIRMVAGGVNRGRVATLAGEPGDLDNPDYHVLKRQLAQIRLANDKCRFIYLMGRRPDGTLFFFVDSEPPDSKDYSPPGQAYPEASASFLRVFTTGSGIVEGPVHDRWGSWVSALVPLMDPQSQRRIAVLGIDVDARTWRREVVVNAALPTLLALLLLAVLALGAAEARSRARLRASESRYAMTFAAVRDGLWDYHVSGNRLDLSAMVRAVLGYGAGDVPDRADSWHAFIHPEDRPRVESAIRHGIETNESGALDIRMRTKSGDWRWVGVRGSVTERDKDGRPLRMVGTLSDVTERKQAEERIRGLLVEKEILLRETHHRVKNNLGVIHGLLTLQANGQADDHARGVLLEAAGRVQSMMVLYDRLYRSPLVGSISLREYLPPLIVEIMAVFPDRPGVALRSEIEDTVLESGKLWPVGIILNELITNAMKYAFAGRSQGEITVKATREGGRVLLTVADDGVGMPAAPASGSPPGFGHHLVEMLVRQLQGTLVVATEGGTRFSIDFPV